MWPLRTLAPCLLLLLLSLLAERVSPSSSKRARGTEQRAGAGGKPPVSGRGKFSAKEMQCTWTAQDGAEEAVRLAVRCENPQAHIHGGETDLRCEYTGKPRKCPAFTSKPGHFWKQVSRIFKRLGAKVCRDDRALVRVGACKRAPRDAHFKLDVRTAVASGQSGGESQTPAPPPGVAGNSTVCRERIDHRDTAEQYCSSSWASVCAFMLSMLQSRDC